MDYYLKKIKKVIETQDDVNAMRYIKNENVFNVLIDFYSAMVLRNRVITVVWCHLVSKKVRVFLECFLSS